MKSIFNTKNIKIDHPKISKILRKIIILKNARVLKKIIILKNARVLKKIIAF
jgi:hypothetical protein